MAEDKQKTINELSQQFESIVNDKNNASKEYDESVNLLNQAYDDLLKLEHDKQSSLDKQIDELRNSKEKEESEFENLSQEYASKSYFHQLLNDSIKENESLENKRILLKNRYDQLMDAFNKIDVEINNKQIDLCKSFKNKADEINNYYQKIVDDNKKQINNVDVLGKNIPDLFKK